MVVFRYVYIGVVFFVGMSLDRRLREGVLSRRDVLKLGLSGLAGLVLACETTRPPNGGPGNGDPDPGNGTAPGGGPLFVPAGVSASEYGSSLPFDISAYDSNAPGVFTVDEMSLVDVLSDLHRDGVGVSVLQGIVDRFHTVGPVIPHAVRRSYEEYKKDREFDSELVFGASTIGVHDPHQMLPVWSLPSRWADPSFVPDGFDPVIDDPPTGFPINYAVNRVSGPDWLNEDRSRLLSGLKLFAGVEACNVGENILNVSSMNMNLYRGLDDDSPTGWEVLWRDVSLPTLPGAHVTVEDIFIERRGPFEHDRANVRFREHVHPYDRSLVDTPWLEHSLGHVTPGELRYFSKDDFSFSEGDVVGASDVSLRVTPFMPAYLLDFLMTGPPTFGAGYDIVVHPSMMDDPEFARAYSSGSIPSLFGGIGPVRGSGKRVVDVMMADFYPEGIQVRPVQPRYSQNLKVYAPCSVFAGEPTIR